MNRLSTGAIAGIMAGEKVEKPVLQILDFKIIPTATLPYIRLLASDGEYMCNMVALAREHNYLYFAGELTAYAIIVVDEYELRICKKTHDQTSTRRVLYITDLTVLTPGSEVGRIIGDVILYSEYAKVGQLHAGALARMMSGADIRQPVLQLLSLRRKLATVGGVCQTNFTGIISDGVTYTNCSILVQKLRGLAHKRQYCIVRLDKYKTSGKGHQTLLTLQELTVLVPGYELSRPIGNPVLVTNSAVPLPKALLNPPQSLEFCPVLRPILPASSVGSSHMPAPNSRTAAKPSEEVVTSNSTNSDASQAIAYFNSRGVLKRMLNYAEVDKPVLQILRFEELNLNAITILCPLVSDCQHIYNNCVFNIKLNSMYTEGRLPKYSVVRVNNFSVVLLKKRKPPIRVLNITDVTVLCCGTKVGYPLGNPVMLPAFATKTSPFDDIKPLIPTFFPSGAIPKMLRGTQVGRPVLQIVKRRTYHVDGKSQLALLLSDGKYKSDYVYVLHRLHKLFAELTPRAIIQVDQYYTRRSCNCLTGVAIAITELTLIAPGKEVNCIFGDPRRYTSKDSVTKPAAACKSPTEKGIVSISTIAGIEPTKINTMGICTQLGPIVKKLYLGKTSKMRDLTLVDCSNTPIKFTLVGDYAIHFSGAVKSILLVKGAVLIDFNGFKSLTTDDYTEIYINPDTPECRRLRQWYEKVKMESDWHAK